MFLENCDSSAIVCEKKENKTCFFHDADLKLIHVCLNCICNGNCREGSEYDYSVKISEVGY